MSSKRRRFEKNCMPTSAKMYMKRLSRIAKLEMSASVFTMVRSRFCSEIQERASLKSRNSRNVRSAERAPPPPSSSVAPKNDGGERNVSTMDMITMKASNWLKGSLM